MVLLVVFGANSRNTPCLSTHHHCSKRRSCSTPMGASFRPKACRAAPGEEQPQMGRTLQPLYALVGSLKNHSKKIIRLCNPTAVTGSNSRLRCAIGRDLDHIWETIGRCGRQVDDNWETIGRPHLQDRRDKWETTSERQMENNCWKTNSGGQLGIVEDNSGKQFGDHIWETSGRQLADTETLGRPHVGDSWESTSGRHHLREKGKITTTRQQAVKPWTQLADIIWEAAPG